jgi:hypothetical protein
MIRAAKEQTGVRANGALALRVLMLNPLFRLLVSLAWVVGLLAIVIGFGLFPGAGFAVAGALAGGYLLFLAGAGAAALLPARRQLALQTEERQRRGYRYLCLDCLCFDAFRLACPECRKPLDPLQTAADGAFADRCGECGARVAPVDEVGKPALAYCSHCSAVQPARDVHRQRIEALGVLDERDLETVAAATGAVRSSGAGVSFLRVDGSESRACVMSLADLNARGGALPPAHAGHSVRALWTQHTDALLLGQTLDVFVAHHPAGPEQLRSATIAFPAVQPEPAARRLLETRMGAIYVGVEPAVFISRHLAGGEAPPQPVAPATVHPTAEGRQA